MNIPKFLVIFKRVVEVDMIYTYFVYFLAVALGAMYEFLFIVSIVSIAVTFILTIGYLKNNDKLVKAGKIANVAVTVVAFINLFANDLNFEVDLFSSA